MCRLLGKMSEFVKYTYISRIAGHGFQTTTGF